MEEALNEALLQAGNILAEALRGGLLTLGLGTDIAVRTEDGRVTVVSRSRAVWAAEFGEAGKPPSAPVSGILAAAGDEVVRALRSHLKETLR